MKAVLKYISALKWVIILLAITAIGWLIYSVAHPKEAEVTVGKGRITDIEPMVRLCSVEIYNEVPVLDTLSNKVIFGVQKQTGSISFNVENLQVDTVGDTLRVMLPAEIVELRESTDKDAWQVIDTKAIGPLALLRSDKFTAEEENLVKRKLMQRSTQRLYKNGTVKKARAEARANLQQLLKTTLRCNVEVYDLTPDGASGSRTIYQF